MSTNREPELLASATSLLDLGNRSGERGARAATHFGHFTSL